MKVYFVHKRLFMFQEAVAAQPMVQSYWGLPRQYMCHKSSIKSPGPMMGSPEASCWFLSSLGGSLEQVSVAEGWGEGRGLNRAGGGIYPNLLPRPDQSTWISVGSAWPVAAAGAYPGTRGQMSPHPKEPPAGNTSPIYRSQTGTGATVGTILPHRDLGRIDLLMDCFDQNYYWMSRDVFIF